MIPILSLVTSIKDYLEVVHKFIEYDSVNIDYTELGSILTFFLISIKNCIGDFFNFSWLLKENVWSLPIIIPDISSAMISEISVLDGYFHNTFNFLDTPISYGMPTQNAFIVCLEKLTIGLINSFFLFLPTSIAHIITLRRFVMQGLDAGYISGLGTIAGNIFWLASVILGFRFFVIPWLSLDIFRYVLGFILLVKYMWDSYNERKMVLEDVSKRKIFLLNFLLALTEQTSIYPFISNISISPEASILETVPSLAFGEGGASFIVIHLAYLLGIALGSLSLLHFSCWFWENPAFKLYMWVISSFKVSTSLYYKVLNFTFLYLTMLSAVCSIPYYGLDYTITNPLGYVSDDRIIQDKVVLETSFLGSKASDRNTRRNRGRHGRRERWKRRIRKYRTFDASLYDQGIYDLFTIEDLNYGFDRFWLRRKLRNHRVRFRFFPGPWMRSFKKQLAKPRLESFTGPRVEFFRILFEQVYHPSFHAYQTNSNMSNTSNMSNMSQNPVTLSILKEENKISNDKMNNNLGSLKGNENIYSKNISSSLYLKNRNFTSLLQKATLKKFLRKFENRVKTSQIVNLQNNDNIGFSTSAYPTSSSLAVLSNSNSISKPNFNLTALNSIKQKNKVSTLDPLDEKEILLLNNSKNSITSLEEKALKKQRTNISRKDSQILQYRSLLTNSALPPASQGLGNEANNNDMLNKATQKQNKNYESLMLLHPLKFYVQQDTAFKRKLRYYSPNIFRKFSVENNAPYFRVMMKRYFYNYKPNLRWERTLKAASLRKARRKTTRIPKQLQKSDFSNGVLPLTPSGLAKQGVDASFAASAISVPRGPVPLGEKREAIEGKDSGFGDKIVTPLEKAAFQKSTYNYSVVSKRANRYRYQIYKDVLQHWYYSPFNRFLLKLDVDSFIRRQPNAHFLTAKEENLLHLRRFLLSEHYNTLRWYTNMEHYRSMKTQLNSGVKSFSSRAYNQQFSGTFKKVRHLFAITPSISTASSSPFNSFSQLLSNAAATRSLAPDGKDSKGTASFPSFPSFPSGERGKEVKEEQKITNVLKFDQPLYNEYPTNEVLPPLLNPLVIHEELLPEFYGTSTFASANAKTQPTQPTQSTQLTEEQKEKQQQSALNLNNDLLSQSQNIVRQYLIQTRSVREEYIKQLLKENNYSELTQFIYKGQKLRGNEPVTNQKLLNNQEKTYLLTAAEKAEIENSLSDKISSFSDKNKTGPQSPAAIEEEFYLTYLKNWKRRVNDQESLKNYLTRRFEKREKRKQKKEKQLLSKLNRLESWLSVSDESYSLQSGSNQGNLNKSPENMALASLGKTEPLADSLLTTGLQKSILDGMFVLNNVDTKVVSLNEKNLWKVLLLSKIKSTSFANSVREGETNFVNSPTFVRLQDLSLHFSDLKNIQKLKLSNEIKTTVQTTRELLQSVTNDKNKVGVYSSLKNKIAKNLSPRNYTKISSKISNFTQLCLNSAKTAKNTYLNLSKLTDLLKPIKRKSLNDWRKKERVLSKQKRSRKEFKLLNKKSESVSTFIDSSGLLNSSRSPAEQGNEGARAQDVVNGARFVNSVSKANENELDLILQAPLRKKRDQNNNDSNNSTEPSFISYAFKRKRTPQRRSRVRRNRGVFKKRTLSDSLRKDFSQYLNEKEINLKLQDDKTLKQSPSFERKTAFALLSKGTNQDQEAEEKENIILKQRKSKQRKERFWKQKRSKYSQKRRKYRKRRRYTVVKIRNLNKQFKRIKNQIEIQNWWWQQFIPSIQASNEALWQIEKDKLIQQKLSQLSTSDILERDSLNLNNQTYNTLQIGKKDFKPLALPEAIRLKQENSSAFAFAKANGFSENLIAPSNSTVSTVSTASTASTASTNENEDLNSFNVLNKLYESLFIKNNSEIQQDSLFKEFLLPNTNLPFYTGWDESLRKLIITNRMLSRKDAGFTIPNNQTLLSQFPQGNDLLKEKAEQEQLEYTLAPLQGMNAATTLYWQIPFTTYDPDQFFALGMDGFSPIGWRKFLFRHSILKTWLTNKETYSTGSEAAGGFAAGSNGFGKAEQKQPQQPVQASLARKHKPLGLVIKTKNNPLTWSQTWGNLNKEESRSPAPLALLQVAQPSVAVGNLYKSENSLFSLSQQNKFKQQKKAFAISRRLKKRYRRVKKHPRTPVWFPSGPLLNQVLPVHYIYVFYKRARLPRDRYLKRRLLNVKTLNNNPLSFNLIKQNSQISFAEADGINSTSFYDFTLRKRLKPKRKYHLKRDYYASNVIIPRRFKFMSISSSSSANGALPQKEIAQSAYIRKWRPLSSLKIHKPIADVVKEQLLLRKSAVLREQKQRSSKQPNIRVKQLRRRVQRQILRSVWRYRPRAGGFVWPGDYLKLELVKAPKLQSPSIKDKDKEKEFKNSSLAAMDLRSTGFEANLNKEVEKKEKTKKQKRKKKRTLVEWQIQPKKYLYDKHNLKVLKKKLQKAKRSFDYSSNTLIPSMTGRSPSFPCGAGERNDHRGSTLNVLRNSINAI